MTHHVRLGAASRALRAYGRRVWGFSANVKLYLGGVDRSLNGL